MHFSKHCIEQIDACRFCWMCRHICPIGNATGQERNTARARALGLSLVARDAAAFDLDMVKTIYECALCGACTKECATGYDPLVFIKEARLCAALEGKLPDDIAKLVARMEATGSIYEEKTFALPDMPDNDTLLFLGEDTLHHAHDCAKNAITLLEKLGLNFTVLKKEPSSGYSMYFLVGAAAETQAIANQCARTLSKYKTVICYDPADAKMMKQEYKEWGIDLVPNVVTFTSVVAERIHSSNIPLLKRNITLTPQDSPFLSRDLEETQPIRSILSACGNVSEMLLWGKDTMLAGNLIMRSYLPETITLVAQNRWKNANGCKTTILVTESPADYVALSSTKPADIQLMTIEEVVLKCL